MQERRERQSWSWMMQHQPMRRHRTERRLMLENQSVVIERFDQTHRLRFDWSHCESQWVMQLKGIIPPDSTDSWFITVKVIRSIWAQLTFNHFLWPPSFWKDGLTFFHLNVLNTPAPLEMNPACSNVWTSLNVQLLTALLGFSYIFE